MTPDNILYEVTDLLYMDLHEVDGGRMRGFITRKCKAGPWEFDADISVISDCLGEQSCSFFVKVIGSLWLYVVNEHKKHLLVTVLDGAQLKLHVKDMAGYGGKSIAATYDKLKNGIATSYVWDAVKHQWDEDAFVHLEYLSGTKNPLTVVPTAKAVSKSTD
jgi:hypothetical protein